MWITSLVLNWSVLSVSHTWGRWFQQRHSLWAWCWWACCRYSSWHKSATTAHGSWLTNAIALVLNSFISRQGKKASYRSHRVGVHEFAAASHGIGQIDPVLICLLGFLHFIFAMFRITRIVREYEIEMYCVCTDFLYTRPFLVCSRLFLVCSLPFLVYSRPFQVCTPTRHVHLWCTCP